MKREKKGRWRYREWWIRRGVGEKGRNGESEGGKKGRKGGE